MDCANELTAGSAFSGGCNVFYLTPTCAMTVDRGNSCLVYGRISTRLFRQGCRRSTARIASTRCALKPVNRDAVAQSILRAAQASERGSSPCPL